MAAASEAFARSQSLCLCQLTGEGADMSRNTGNEMHDDFDIKGNEVSPMLFSPTSTSLTSGNTHNLPHKVSPKLQKSSKEKQLNLPLPKKPLTI